MRFKEVFKKAILDRESAALFEDLEVENIKSNTEADTIRVLVTSPYLIPRNAILKTQGAICDAYFPDGMEVHIDLKYKLSGLYTPKTLWEVYRDSIISELTDEASLNGSLLRHAHVEFTGEDEMNVTLENSTVARRRERSIESFLMSIYLDRCNLPVKISFDYEDRPESNFRKESEHRINKRVEEISERVFHGTRIEEDDGTLATVSVDPVFAGVDSLGTTGSLPKITPEMLEKAKTEGAEAVGAKAAKEKTGFDSKEGKSGNTDKNKVVGASRNKKDKGDKKDSYRRPLNRSEDPNILYGRDASGDITPISEITDEIGMVVIKGRIFNMEDRALRNEKHLFSFAVTDEKDSIMCKIFTFEDQKDEFAKAVKNGEFVRVKGVAKYDTFSHEITISSIDGIAKSLSEKKKREDLSLKKRVELHCHTKYSDMDGVSYAADIIKRAHSWGMNSLAITDHGVVQAFPEAMHTLEKINKDNENPFKVLYGVEGYLVDDLTQAVVNDKGQSLMDSFVVFDIETTGFSPVDNRIIEIGAVRVVNGECQDTFSEFVNPKVPLSFTTTSLTGITDDMVIVAETIDKVLPRFLDFIGDDALVAHNANFDMSFIMENCKRLGIEKEFTYLDTVAVSRTLLTRSKKHTLDHVCKDLGISLLNHHRAVDDATATAQIFARFVSMLAKKNVTTLKEVNDYTSSSVDRIMKSPSYHVIILAKSEIGRMNLYRLVSESHCKYFNSVPRMPKSLINKYREGLIVGSACEAGELFRALVDKKTDETLSKIASFYDYLEIQPIGNNEFMVRDNKKYPDIQNDEDLRDLNRRIVSLGEKLHIPVCATCDVHFLDPEDEVYRRILMSNKGFSDADQQAPLYLRTTEEMLAEFEYLGEEKAMEVVVDNTNRIASMCEFVSPIHPDKCPPEIPHSDETLKEICYTRAHEIYGEELPEVVSKRLERELNSIISNGFAVMYIIAQKLVWKSNEDGYLVGSRGSVGSSFVATMAGITEVNPLSPHYYCSKCHYSDFDSEDVKAYAGRAGCDMPDKNCPVCGEKLKKDGFDIPFETFLGFKGDKEPDIDLNFSGEYQSKAHKYTEVIFGAGQTFRAGTIGTVAEKTACGYVRKYFEEKGIPKRNCEITRIAQGCIDVRRTTGQHPGGIIVLPLGHDINQFTPVQHPANDMETDTITTHFDYHSIDHNLLKLDILGHDDPTMIRMLQDLTGIDPLTIPLDDPKVMTLFQSTEALGITPDQIGGTKLGSLGIPEFGTDFAMQMLIDTHPTSFSDLVRIAGLAHGTDVWLGNAQKLIAEGTATISTAICTRDDIMTYLIGMGLDPGMSFKIMEMVRKGKVAGGKCDAWPEWKEEMIKHNVPDWYVWSCEKIKYMFPKAHAAAYVMMAWRIAYCKVNYPLAYYAAYFSIRATAFNYEKMCQGPERLNAAIEEYKRKAGITGSEDDSKKASGGDEEVSNKEEGEYKDMRLVQEMYARGFRFIPIDIFRAHAKNFQIIDGMIMPSLTSIEGVADSAATGIVEACKKGPFTSKTDFKNRAKVTDTVLRTMDHLGLLGNLPENNQISLFDSF
ncbi:MAG: PolC-type DNA polymerase III [Lachnospiraceae bacterium]|nr:PolC-type DNA polymerase III [Lachnospiraceae bacterium]